MPLHDSQPEGLRFIELVEQFLGKQEFDISSGKYWRVLRLRDTGVKDEVQSHHGQGDVMMPWHPRAHLILMYTELFFDILKVPHTKI